jgi:Transcriptional regulatory protein, C terminal
MSLPRATQKLHLDTTAILRFGEWQLDRTERLLRRGDTSITLRARAFDVLCALAARPGQLVTKDQLLDEVWRGLVVEENNIAAQMLSLLATVSGMAVYLAVCAVVAQRFTRARRRAVRARQGRLPRPCSRPPKPVFRARRPKRRSCCESMRGQHASLGRNSSPTLEAVARVGARVLSGSLPWTSPSGGRARPATRFRAACRARC